MTAVKSALDGGGGGWGGYESQSQVPVLLGSLLPLSFSFFN